MSKAERFRHTKVHKELRYNYFANLRVSILRGSLQN